MFEYIQTAQSQIYIVWTAIECISNRECISTVSYYSAFELVLGYIDFSLQYFTCILLRKQCLYVHNSLLYTVYYIHSMQRQYLHTHITLLSTLYCIYSIWDIVYIYELVCCLCYTRNELLCSTRNKFFVYLNSHLCTYLRTKYVLTYILCWCALMRSWWTTGLCLSKREYIYPKYI